jgi:hypothetical protein
MEESLTTVEPKHFPVEEEKKNDHLLHCATSEHIEANKVPLACTYIPFLSSLMF